jgi:two-component system NtrC family sensor kinase
VAGRGWADAFASWGLPAMPRAETPGEPCETYVYSPTGEAVHVVFLPIPSRQGPTQTMAVFRSALGNNLTDRQEQLCGLGEISAGVAHEMNNALTLLAGWLELLMADHEDNPSLRPTLELLMDEASRIGRLTRNLLEVARGAAEPQRELSVRDILDEVLTLVRYEMQHSNIELERIVPEDLPPVSASSGRLKQAVLNLLLNARQAMPSGGKVTVSAIRDRKGYLNLAVSDTGCGIPDELQPRIFSPFFTTKKNGTGLGLSVTRRIVEDHGGTIKLESKPGAGTRFTMRIPSMVV